MLSLLRGKKPPAPAAEGAESASSAADESYASHATAALAAAAAADGGARSSKHVGAGRVVGGDSVVVCVDELLPGEGGEIPVRVAEAWCSGACNWAARRPAEAQ
jgi:hypothetical protein